MNTDAKIIIGIIVLTLLIVAGGVFFLSKGQNLTTGSLAPSPVAMSLLVNDQDPSTGSKDAKVTVVEFADFQCPACRAAQPVLQQIRDKYGNQIRFIYRYYPLTQIHAHAMEAAKAAQAAADQGKFWDMHDVLYEHQNDWADKGGDMFVTYADQLHLDINKFKQDMGSQATLDRITADMKDGDQAGVDATPTVFISGKKYNGFITVDNVSSVIDDELKK